MAFPFLFFLNYIKNLITESLKSLKVWALILNLAFWVIICLAWGCRAAGLVATTPSFCHSFAQFLDYDSIIQKLQS